MKKIIVSLLLAALFLNISTERLAAQESRWDARLGVGWYSFDDLLSIFGVVASAFNKADHRDGNAYLLNPNLNVTCRFSNWFSLGAGLAYGTMNTNGYDADNKLINSADFDYTTLLLYADTYYLRRDMWALYGSYGLGATLFTNTNESIDSTSGELKSKRNNNLHVNFAVYPIAVRFGRRYGGFCELGLGCRGFVNAGMFYNF